MISLSKFSGFCEFDGNIFSYGGSYLVLDWRHKQLELQRLTDAAALCVPHENEEEEGSEGKVTAIAQRAGAAYR